MQQGLYGWMNRNLRGRKSQRGFTLIELLVVVTILGILAAIVTLSLVGLTTNANIQSCNSEYKTVQAAIDAYMANNQLSILPVSPGTVQVGPTAGSQAAFTNDMTDGAAKTPVTGNGSLPLYNPAPDSSHPNYTRNGTTQFYYTWDQFGRITAIGSNAGGAGVTGCAPK